MSGRIPQPFIDDLLNRIDIVELISQRVKLKKSGKNYSACCPFHQEKTPSFTVTPDKQFYYCFGCGVSGNALSFLMELDRMDFLQAVDHLAGQLGLEVPREAGIHQPQPRHTPLFDCMERCSNYFVSELNNSRYKQAQDYLRNRGLDQQTCRLFQIGFAPPGWHNLQTHFAHDPQKEDELLVTGMMVDNDEKKSRYDRFRNRITFPIHDARGRVIAFGGRVLDDSKPKYLNSPESPIFQKGSELYGLYQAKNQKKKLHKLIVVEGYMDVIVLSQHGIHNVVATLGTATTPTHTNKLFKLVPEITFCFDGDTAGKRAAWRALESTLPLMQDGKMARFLFLPQDEDPDSTVCREGRDAFLQRIDRDAISLDHFLFQQVQCGIDLNTIDGCSRFVTELQPYLNRIPEGLYKQMLSQKLAGVTGLTPETIATYLNQTSEQTIDRVGMEVPPAQAATQLPHSQPPSPSSKHTQTGQVIRMGPAVYAIRNLLCKPSLVLETDPALLPESSDPDVQLLMLLIKSIHAEPDLKITTLIAQLADTKQGERLTQIAQLSLSHQPNLEEYREAVNKLVRQYHELALKRDMQTLRNELSHKKPSQLDPDLLRRYRELFRQQKTVHGNSVNNDG